MRVTNSMISNSSRSHIANAKNELMKRENQYTTQKKILRPSDDPVVAIRSLQLRTTYSKIEQYISKNVQDAMEWMDTSETTLDSIHKVLENVKGLCNQGAHDPLDVDERHSVLSALQSIVTGIFEDNANADYAGRYLFTGYRTDTSLLFPTDTGTELEYEIKENFTGDNIKAIKYVTGGANFNEATTADQYATQVPKQKIAYRMALSYDNCSNAPRGGLPASALPAASGVSISLTYVTGTPPNTVTVPLDVTALASTAENAYTVPDSTAPAPATAHYLYDTGEIIFSKGAYSQIQENDADIKVTYTKKQFDKGDIRPEMYFECTSYNTASLKTTNYREPSNQNINYEVNFSQTSTVNVQARDAISTEIYRAVDYIAQTIGAVDAVDKKLTQVETSIANKKNSNDADKEEKLEDYGKLKEMLEAEKNLLVGAMQEAFGMGLTMVDVTQDQLNVANADLGARHNRLNLTYDKLLDQSVDTEEKLSNNEDIDIADAYINLNQADLLYQASLSATAKILGNSLLNYI